jgi:hypothetical protein
MMLLTLQLAIPFVWFGLVAGISFFEAPLKFRAPNITLALGLSIGRLIFFWLNKIEIALAALLAVTLALAPPDANFAYAAFALLALILFLESIWLLPRLDKRARAVIGGVEPRNAPHPKAHLAYIACDLAKLVLLASTGAALAADNLSV